MTKLKKIRIAKQMSCKDMSNILNISKSFYWQIESMQRRLAYDMAIKIAQIFNMTPDELFLEDYLKQG